MQPAPKPGGVDVWPLVIQSMLRSEYAGVPQNDLTAELVQRMAARDALGRERYGTSLQTGNGRDALMDALEEALDLCAYTRQAFEEDSHAADWTTHRMAVQLAARLLERIRRRDAPKP